MIMASLNSIQNTTTTILLFTTIIIAFLLHLLCPVSCQHAIPPTEPLCEEKNRLGSMPPSCHNKCSQCHPCMAVQVPTSPSHEHDPLHPGLAPSAAVQVFFLQGNSYSNYKPLSWKCHCGDHFFNP